MSSTVKAGWNSFQEGFFGSFRLAAAIVLAIIGVASAFVNGTEPPRHQGEKTTSL